MIVDYKVLNLESRRRTDILDACDLGWHSYDPDGYVIPAEDYAAGYDRLLAPWAAGGVHPTPAGHAALAEAWLRLITAEFLAAPRDSPGTQIAPVDPCAALGRRGPDAGCG